MELAADEVHAVTYETHLAWLEWQALQLRRPVTVPRQPFCTRSRIRCRRCALPAIPLPAAFKQHLCGERFARERGRAS